MISKLSTRDGYGKKLGELVDDRIIVLTADLAESSRVNAFKEKHPDRFIQVGISEQDMFGMANGLALEGKIPFTNTFAAFCLRGAEQIRLICINNAPVKIVGHHSGINLGADGVSQMCENDVAYMRSLPNMTVVVPCDALEAQKATEAITKVNGPCYLRLFREPFPVITNEYSEFKIGKANILREGHDVLIVACGTMISESLRAAQLLEEKSITATIMNMHTIKPLDTETLLKHATKQRAIVTVEEHSVIGGLGSAVVEALAFTKIPVKIIGIQDAFGESGKSEELLQKFGLTAEDIVKGVVEVLKFKEHSEIVREVDEIMKEINGKPKSIDPETQTSSARDPRNRITKLNPEQKKQFDDVLTKMFGGRKNGNSNN